MAITESPWFIIGAITLVVTATIFRLVFYWKMRAGTMQKRDWIMGFALIATLIAFMVITLSTI